MKTEHEGVLPLSGVGIVNKRDEQETQDKEHCWWQKMWDCSQLNIKKF